MAFLAFSEVGVRDLPAGELHGRPVGWKIARYSGPAEGHKELRGYYRGHRKAAKKEPRRRPRRRKRSRRRGR